MQTVQLTCEFRGIPIPTVNWLPQTQLNLSSAIASGQVSVTTNPTINHRIVSVLTIQSIQLEEAGRYTCTAETVGLSESVTYDITTSKLPHACFATNLVLYYFSSCVIYPMAFFAMSAM